MKKKLALIVIIFAVIGFFLINKGESAGDKPDHADFVAQRADLNISVIETGTIKPRSQVVIKNQLESSATITYIIDEGTVVKEGDLLVEFDASELEDDKINQEIQLQNAEASYISAKENMAVEENQAQSDIEQAELNLEFAKQDLEKYNKGEYPNELTEIEQNIDLADEELKRAEYELTHSKNLFAEKYISETEFKADELAVKQKEKNLLIAKMDLTLLKDYTHKRKLTELESDVRQTEMALERTKRKAKANVTQAQANLKAKEAEFKRQQDRYDRIVDELSKTKLYAPANGMVIYETSMNRGRWDSQQNPLEVGLTVRGREDIIYLPTADTTKADVKIHESSLKKIQLGQRASIKVDALPDAVFSGYIAKISPLPDNNWMNPDINKYPCEIYVDENKYDLKNGMNCRCEILIEELKDVVYVPLQAVIQVGDEHFVEVKEGKEYIRRKVEIGLDDNKWMHIVSGLEEGEIVSLTPTLKDTEVQPKSKGKGPGDNNKEAGSGKEGNEHNAGDRKQGGPGRPEGRDGQMMRAPGGQPGQQPGQPNGQRPKMPANVMQVMQKMTDDEKKKLQDASEADKPKIFAEMMQKYSDKKENEQDNAQKTQQ